MAYFILMGRRIPKQAITGFKFQNETDNIRPFLSIRIRGKNEKEVVYPRTGVPVFMLKDVGIGFRTIEGATEVANLLVKYNAFKIESRFLTGSYEQFWIIKESVCPAIKGGSGV